MLTSVTRGHAADDVRTAITLAAELGADIVLVPFFLRGDLDGEEGFVRCVESFRPLCAEAGSGVTLCYEGTLPARDSPPGRSASARPRSGATTTSPTRSRSGSIRRRSSARSGGSFAACTSRKSRTARGDARPGLGRVDYAECALALAHIGYDGWLVLGTPAAPRRWSRVT